MLKPVPSDHAIDDAYSLDDRYRRQEGQVVLSGTEALVRLPIEQRRRDRAMSRNTAGFISGYRGSPLGGYDQALWRAARFLKEHDIVFRPGVNEDLAATAVLGSQQVESEGGATVDGVFAVWYGKGPGVDRSGDALKHGNYLGSSPHGGVLVVAGDDHGGVSSSMPHQSEQAMMSWNMPVLNPADVADYIPFGLYGFALSRFTGLWAGFKAISETVESSATVDLACTRLDIATPDDFVPPVDGLHYRWDDRPGPVLEARMEAKLAALAAFARRNPLDRVVVDARDAWLGVVTTGKAHLDAMEALRRLGLTTDDLAAASVRLLKVGLSWPLEREGMRRFADGLRTILVIEEKGPVVERQLRDILYDLPNDHRPAVIGKRGIDGAPLLPSSGELRPSRLAPVLAKLLAEGAPKLEAEARYRHAYGGRPQPALPEPTAQRVPYFCAGCPHNTSTRVPEGSKAMTGIGCHYMASWMDRDTSGMVQMGGEGVNWVGVAPFTSTPHIFQNLGDGTYYHSGLMAIRQAIAAGINVTYKILYNDAVAMTGGQPIDGSTSVAAIVRQVISEGVRRVAVVAEQPERHRGGGALPTGVTVHSRDELDGVQRDLRETPGVTVLVYDQACAAEKRRRRKRGLLEDPPRRVVINEAVCEGCGDCGEQSNCVSVLPLETPLGRKRTIDQTACNKDFSCLKGFCPSFVTVEGGALRQTAPEGGDDGRLQALLGGLPHPQQAALGDAPAEILVAGVGGTGVVTVGALLVMAAQLEGKAASALDFMGFAQKGGAVLSHVRIAGSADALNQVRIDEGAADLLLACDMVVGASNDAVATLAYDSSRVVCNTYQAPTAALLRDRDADNGADALLTRLRLAAGPDNVSTIDAHAASRRLTGSTVGANVFMLGFAWQMGLVPLGLAAIGRAIELNGVAVEANKAIFAWGRVAAHDPEALRATIADEAVDEVGAPQDLAALIEDRTRRLTDYQDARYAARYREFVETVRVREAAVGGGRSQALTEAVARCLFKLMAYKDEYEVARLFTDGAFAKRLDGMFQGDVRLNFHMAPPMLPLGRDAAGRPRKLRLGPWLLPALRLLAKMKRLRGTPLDPFGRLADRREERALIAEYRATVETLVDDLTAEALPAAVEIARLPDAVRGFGPVKAQAIADYHARTAALLAGFRAGETGPAAAPRRAAIA